MMTRGNQAVVGCISWSRNERKIIFKLTTVASVEKHVLKKHATHE